MGLLDDKRNIFNTIGAYVSFMEQNKPPNRTDLYSSVNNTKDIIPFLLDVLKVVAGTDGIKELTGKMVTNLVDEAEPKIKIAVKKQFIQANAGDSLSNSFKTNGVDLPVKDVDISGKFMTAPTSDVGDLLYDNTTTNFDSLAYSALENPGTTIPFNVVDMEIQYNDTLDTFNISPPAGITSTVGDYFINYIDNAPLINKKEFISNIMNGIYGTLSKGTNRTTDQMFEQLKVEKLLDQALADDDSFEISVNDYNSLLTKAEQISEGIVYYDMGCGLISAELPLSGLTNLVSNISGATDPYAISNNIENTITDASSSDADATQENKESIRDGFFQRLIKLFALEFIKAAVISPQMRVLFGIIGSLQNNDVVQIGTASEDMKKFKVIIMCLVKEIIKIVVEFIFNLVVSYLIKLITPVIKKILKEKINQYSKIILSLTPISQIAEATGLV